MKTGTSTRQVRRSRQEALRRIWCLPPFFAAPPFFRLRPNLMAAALPCPAFPDAALPCSGFPDTALPCSGLPAAGRTVFLPAQPARAQRSERIIHAAMIRRTTEEGRETGRKDQILFVKVSSMENATSDVSSPLEFVRFVTVSLMVTAMPCARKSSAIFSTPERTSR